MLLARELDHRAGGSRGQRVRELPGLQSEQLHVVVEGLAGNGEAHPAEIRDHAGGGGEACRAQAPADLVRLVDHRAEAQLHQLVGSDEPGEPGTDDGDLGPVQRRRDRAQSGRMGQEVIVAEREVRVQHGDGRDPGAGVRRCGCGGRQFGGGGHEISAFIGSVLDAVPDGRASDSSRYSSWLMAATLEFFRP